MSAAGNTDTSNTTTTTTTDTTAATKMWFDGADAETIGRIQNRGWDKMSANEAAMAAVKAHQEAEKHLGVPANQLLRLPKDASDDVAIKAMRQRLGVPDDVKGYEFKDIKFADGTELPDALRDTLSKAFLDTGVPKDQAPAIVKELAKYMDDQKRADVALEQTKMMEAAERLQKSWGPNEKANTFVVNKAAEVLGWGKDFMDKLSGVLDKDVIAQGLLVAGQRMGEDKLIRVENSQTNGIMTREQATARIAELTNDTQFGQRLFNGDSRAKAEFDALTRMLT